MLQELPLPCRKFSCSSSINQKNCFANKKHQPTVRIRGTGTQEKIFSMLMTWRRSFLLQDCEERGLVNIGCDENVSIKELAELIVSEAAYKGKSIFDTTKLDDTPRK